MPDMPDLPYYDDGQAAALESLVTDVNTSTDYQFVSFDPAQSSELKLQTDPNGEGIGSTRRTAFTGGQMVVQLDQAGDTPPQIGHIIKHLGTYYAVDTMSQPRTKGEVVRVTMALTIVRNPILTGLLSAAGQRVAKTGAESMAITTIAMTTVSNRTGGTMAYSIDTSDDSFAALPSGLSLNASTGDITGTPDASTAGSYIIKVKVAETLSGYRTAVGFGIINLTISA